MVILVNRPCLTIQCNWNEELKVSGGRSWVTCKDYGKTGLHGELSQVSMSRDGLPYINASEGFGVDRMTKNSITVTHTDPNCSCVFIAPSVTFVTIHQKSVLCLDVTEGGLGVSICVDNKVLVWDVSTGEVRRELKGHVWDVYTCRFFPSGVVVLTGGADMQLKIWSAETGHCPVTLKGHKAPILDTAIIDRGRNILSVSKDGSARLWDCGQSACLGVVTETDAAINCCALEAVDIDVGVPDIEPSEREVGTESKLLAVGCETGLVRGVGVRSRKPVFELNFHCAVNCCCFLSLTQLVCGMQDGRIHLIDVTKPGEASITWEESLSPVLCLFKYQNGFFSGRADGTCTFHVPESDVCLQLTGPDFDPVYKMAAAKNFVYTACRDGYIRKYDVRLK